jgi:hypothetical protein
MKLTKFNLYLHKLFKTVNIIRQLVGEQRDGLRLSVHPQPLEKGRGALNFHTELQTWCVEMGRRRFTCLLDLFSSKLRNKLVVGLASCKKQFMAVAASLQN